MHGHSKYFLINKALLLAYFVSTHFRLCWSVVKASMLNSLRYDPSEQLDMLLTTQHNITKWFVGPCLRETVSMLLKCFRRCEITLHSR